jgi:hypothetical protein
MPLFLLDRDRIGFSRKRSSGTAPADEKDYEMWQIYSSSLPIKHVPPGIRNQALEV